MIYHTVHPGKALAFLASFPDDIVLTNRSRNMFAVGPVACVWIGHEDWIQVTVEELQCFRARVETMQRIDSNPEIPTDYTAVRRTMFRTERE